MKIYRPVFEYSPPADYYVLDKEWLIYQLELPLPVTTTNHKYRAGVNKKTGKAFLYASAGTHKARKGESEEDFKARELRRVALDRRWPSLVRAALPEIVIERPVKPDEGFAVGLEFHLTPDLFNRRDLDGMVKSLQDIIFKHYNLVDSRVYEYDPLKKVRDGRGFVKFSLRKCKVR